jgi:hypothetical protein
MHAMLSISAPTLLTTCMMRMPTCSSSAKIVTTLAKIVPVHLKINAHSAVRTMFAVPLRIEYLTSDNVHALLDWLIPTDNVCSDVSRISLVREETSAILVAQIILYPS